MSHFGRAGTPLAVSDTLVHTRVHSDPRFGYAVGQLLRASESPLCAMRTMYSTRSRDRVGGRGHMNKDNTTPRVSYRYIDYVKTDVEHRATTKRDEHRCVHECER